MKHLIFLIIFLVLAGCSSLTRQSTMTSGSDRKVNCNDDIVLNVGSIDKGNFALLGPVIPIVPIPSITWFSKGLYIDAVGLETCPIIEVDNIVIDSHYSRKYKAADRSGMSCSYSLKGIKMGNFFTWDTKFRGLTCERKKIEFKKNIRWFYQFMSTA